MNPLESEFEETLRTLRPAAPSLELEERIAQRLAVRESSLVLSAPAPAALNQPPQHVRETSGFGDLFAILRGLGWAAGGALAMFLVMHGPAVPAPQGGASHPVATFAPPPLLPAESTAQLLTASDEGLRYDVENAPVRQVRYSLLERHAWVDPTTGARMEFEVPREDVQFIPVSFQ